MAGLAWLLLGKGWVGNCIVGQCGARLTSPAYKYIFGTLLDLFQQLGTLNDFPPAWVLGPTQPYTAGFAQAIVARFLACQAFPPAFCVQTLSIALSPSPVACMHKTALCRPRPQRRRAHTGDSPNAHALPEGRQALQWPSSPIGSLPTVIRVAPRHAGTREHRELLSWGRAFWAPAPGQLQSCSGSRACEESRSRGSGGLPAPALPHHSQFRVAAASTRPARGRRRVAGVVTGQGIRIQTQGSWARMGQRRHACLPCTPALRLQDKRTDPLAAAPVALPAACRHQQWLGRCLAPC